VKATDILREKAAHVIISDGGSGAWFDGEFVAAPKVDVVDTTAAGDTLLAEWCWQMFGKEDLNRAERFLFRDASRWAVAAGSASCTMPGGAPPLVSLVDHLFSEG
jgi:sugar/nucleoside kinase (ribokinase family)